MFRHAVQDRRRLVHVEEITREQVAAEQHIVLRAVETAVSNGVTGQMQDSQPAPEGKFLPVA
jgi:hypothetical protein